MVVIGPEEAEVQLSAWLREEATIRASLSIEDVPSAGAFVRGLLVEAEGQRAVIGEGGGFVLVLPASEAQVIEREIGNTMTLFMRFGVVLLRLSHGDVEVEAGA